MFRVSAIFLTCFSLAGCYPTVQSTEDFPVYASATVMDTAKFQDCMLDGLSPMRGWLTSRRMVEQQVRSDRVIIDTFVGGSLIQLSSTEIYPNGQVRIRIADYMNVALIDRSSETDVFNNCVAIPT